MVERQIQLQVSLDYDILANGVAEDVSEYLTLQRGRHLVHEFIEFSLLNECSFCFENIGVDELSLVLREIESRDDKGKRVNLELDL